MRDPASATVGIVEIAAVGIFSALAFAGGYLFIAVPNVEVFTAIVFLAGILLGSRNGMWVGLIAQSLYSTLNPFGVSPFPLFAAQVVNRLMVGYVGGRFQAHWEFERSFLSTATVFGIVGLLLTWLYDLMTDYSFFFVSGFSWDQMKTTFALGLPFYLIHGTVNVGIFAFVLPIAIRALRKSQFIKKSGAN